MNKSKLFKGPQLAPGLLPSVKVEDLKEVKCKCGNKFMVRASLIYFANKFQSSSGMPTLVDFPTGFVCTACAKINNFDSTDLPIKEGKKNVISEESQ